jgi:hypothetical protein
MVGSGGWEQRPNIYTYIVLENFSISVTFVALFAALTFSVSLNLKESTKGTNTTRKEECVSVTYFCFETDISK